MTPPTTPTPADIERAEKWCDDFIHPWSMDNAKESLSSLMSAVRVEGERAGVRKAIAILNGPPRGPSWDDRGHWAHESVEELKRELLGGGGE